MTSPMDISMVTFSLRSKVLENMANRRLSLSLLGTNEWQLMAIIMGGYPWFHVRPIEHLVGQYRLRVHCLTTPNAMLDAAESKWCLSGEGAQRNKRNKGTPAMQARILQILCANLIENSLKVYLIQIW